MRYGSVCSGIEAATVAWHPLGWEAQWFSEIEPFPSAILQHHYPNVPNRGDMTKFKEWPDANIDVLVGGTPCQSFSVAGLRKGLDDPRGNLMLTYLGIADKYRPKYLIWENVPGVLSSNGGRDFGTFLGGLGQLGYGFAYRVLDAQYCRTDGHPYAVPQRRRRVFVVGCLGDWRRAAAILFDSESLSRNPPPSRKTGERVAPSLTQSLKSSGGIGMSNQELFSQGGGGLTWTPEIVDRGENIVCMAHGQGGAEIAKNYSPTLNCNHEQPIISWGIPGNWIGRKPENGGNAVEPMENVAPCQTKTDVHAVAFDKNMLDSMQVRRLTPECCEFLQGFPRGYTNIPWRGKLEAPDGLRYKALGNSMAVNVMRVVGDRIEMMERLERARTATV